METIQFLKNQNSTSLITMDDTSTGLSYAVENEKNDTQVEELAMFFITNQQFGCIKYEELYSVNDFMEKNSTSGFLYTRIGPKKEMLKIMNQFILQEAINQYDPGSKFFDLPMVITDYAVQRRQINQSIQNTKLVKVINLL